MLAAGGVPAAEAVLLWGGVFTVLTGVCAVLWRLGRAVARTVKRTDQFMDDWNGEPERPGVPARPGLMERVGRIEEEQVSLRGEVDRANRRLERLCPDCDDLEPPGRG